MLKSLSYIKTRFSIVGLGLIGSAASKYAAINNTGGMVVSIDNGTAAGGSSRGTSRIVREAVQENEGEFAKTAARESIKTWRSDKKIFSPTDLIIMSPNEEALKQINLTTIASEIIFLRHPYFKNSMQYIKVEDKSGGTSGTINPTEIINQNVGESKRHGAKILFNTKIESIKYAGEKTTSGFDKVKIKLNNGAAYITENLILAPGAWLLTGAVRDFIENENGTEGQSIINKLKVKPAYLHFIAIPKDKESDFVNFPATLFKSSSLLYSSGKNYPDGYMMKEVYDDKQYIKVAFHSKPADLSQTEIEALRFDEKGNIPFMLNNHRAVDENKELMLEFLHTHFPDMVEMLSQKNKPMTIERTAACPLSYTKDGSPLFGNISKTHENVRLFIDTGPGIAAKQSDYIGKCLAQNSRTPSL